MSSQPSRRRFTDALTTGPVHAPDAAKRNLAVALRYEKERKTPIVVAKGSGAIANEILRRAKEAGVFVHSSRELIDLLMKVDLDARIPPSLYAAVAEVLAWVYKQDARAAAEAKAAGLDVQGMIEGKTADDKKA